MSTARTASRRTLRLPRVIAATFVVAMFPSLLVAGLVGGGVISSPALSIPIAALVSLVLCQLGGLYWERYRASEDVLFGDLMIWGWARRRLMERRLASAAALFALAGRDTRGKPMAVSAERRMRQLHRLATDLEASDPYTHGHSRRVARYASMIASQMGLAQSEVAKIRVAAALHDVGKINTPIEVLHKPGRLTDEEFAVVKRHPVDGARMISLQVDDEQLESIVRHHHERLDGTGYPSGLTGAEIPLGARIIAVADTFDAITSERPYRRAKPHKAALDILRAEAGTQLDPNAVRAFCSVYFARRPVGALVVLSSAADRALTGLFAGGLSTARIAGIAAATAGLGGAVLVPSTHLTPPGITASASAHPDRTAGLRAGDSLTRVFTSPPCCRVTGARGSSRRRASGRPAPGKPAHPISKPGPPSSGAPGHIPVGGRGGIIASASGQPAQPATSGVTVTLPAPVSDPASATLQPKGSGPTGASATLNAGGPKGVRASGSADAGGPLVPSPSASVHAGGSVAPSASASVHAGGPGL
jgi:putative nucleotidyltransferase with HDIG domain